MNEHEGGVTLCAIYPNQDPNRPYRCLPNKIGKGQKARNDLGLGQSAQGVTGGGQYNLQLNTATGNIRLRRAQQ